VIRRLFWLVLGAVLGVTAYRRVTALARSVPALGRARQAARFGADVREGMALYMERHHGQASSTIESHQGRGEAIEGARGLPARRGRPPGGYRAATDDTKDGR
jgi:hypothetical protein